MVKAKIAQRRVLHYLLDSAARTEWGERHDFSSIGNYRDFSEAVPVTTREDLKKMSASLKNGAQNVSWPGEVSRFAVSAGTTGSGKHLPVTDDRLRSDRRFMRKLALSYLRQRPAFWRVASSHLSLPGDLEVSNGLQIGEISAFTAVNTPSLLRWLQILSPREAVRLSFREKMRRIYEASSVLSPRVIVSAPSWLLTLFERILDKTGAKTISELWPRLRLLVCGGVKLSSYQSRLEDLLGAPAPDFVETYGASEGYFAFSDDLARQDLRLVVDNGIFYEFIPDPLPDPDATAIQQALPIWKTETGVPYGLVVSTNSGLWRCPVNDIVEFTSANPPRLMVKGRVSEMLDDYGEGLYLYEAEEVLNEISREMALTPGVFAVYAHLPESAQAPSHRWFIQMENPLHRGTLERLAKRLDEELRRRNRHYAIRRESGALDPPRICTIRQSDINRWLEWAGKEKAQGKLPRVLDGRDAQVLEPS